MSAIKRWIQNILLSRVVTSLVRSVLNILMTATGTIKLETATPEELQNFWLLAAKILPELIGIGLTYGWSLIEEYLKRKSIK